MLHMSLKSQIKMAANGQKKQDKLLTNSPDGPVVDKLPSTESKVLECEILQLSFPCLKAIVGKENNGSVIPKISIIEVNYRNNNSTIR